MTIRAFRSVVREVADLWDKVARTTKLPPIPKWEHEPPEEHQGTCLEVPSFRQIDGFSCGVVAGWSVIKGLYPERGRRDFLKFYEDCAPSLEAGTSWNRLIKALRNQGIGVSLRRGPLSFTALKKEIENGFPIIAVIDVPAADYCHWVAVYGYKEKSSTARWVYLNNNGLEVIKNGVEVMPFKKFQQLHTDDYLVCWGKV
jgi:hypothetical protein